MNEITMLVQNYGVDVCLLAIVVNFSTGLFKIPIKLISKKFNLEDKINKYITLIPLLFGIVYSGIYQYIVTGNFFSERTAVLAVTAASLSLAIYAILEKFFQKAAASSSSKAEVTEVTENMPVSAETVETNEEIPIAQRKEKIILGNKNDGT